MFYQWYMNDNVFIVMVNIYGSSLTSMILKVNNSMFDLSKNLENFRSFLNVQLESWVSS